jgi:two-component system sensor histidine kinase KdpD
MRELTLLWVADKVDVGLAEYRERHGITDAWETRERVVVAVTGAPGTEHLIRRAARIAQRTHGDLVGVHVVTDEGLVKTRSGIVDRQRSLLEQVGGEYHEVVGGDVGGALAAFARAENATQIVVGSTQRSRLTQVLRGSVINRVVRLSGPIDVHVISHERDDTEHHVARQLRPLSRSAVPARRQFAGWMVALAGVPLLALVLAGFRGSLGLPTALMLFLAVVVLASATGGAGPAVVAALLAFLFANWYFTPPYHHWTVDQPENVVALGVFLGVAVVVSWFVDAAARRATEVARARSSAGALARLAATISEADPVPALLAHLRSAFALDVAALFAMRDGRWALHAADGANVPTTPDEADIVEAVAPGAVLALSGGPIAAEDQAVLKAFAAQLGVVLEHARLRSEAERAHALAEANALRTALLQAVSHDLRTPLASIKASVTSLRQHDVVWPPEDKAAFLLTIENETDRLTRLVENLLNMSRINAGVLSPSLEPVSVEEVVAAALASLGDRSSTVEARLAESLPSVRADPALTERVLANIVDNAVRVSPPGEPVLVEAAVQRGSLSVLVIDRGPGIPAEQRDLVFEPFQKLGDREARGGVGLGLAVARGFTLAMGATLGIDDTPGGGTTMVLTFPVSR